MAMEDYQDSLAKENKRPPTQWEWYRLAFYIALLTVLGFLAAHGMSLLAAAR